MVALATVYKARRRLLCRCYATSNEKLALGITKESMELWAWSEGDEPLSVVAGELFGFNAGSYSEKGLQAAQLLHNNVICWHLKNDAQTLIHVEAGGQKKASCLARMAAHCAQASGVTELSVTDHNLSQLLDSEGNARPFRYQCSAMSKINVFEPKAIPDSANKDSLRSTMFGAAMMGHFSKLPSTEHLGVVWEARRERKDDHHISCPFF